MWPCDVIHERSSTTYVSVCTKKLDNFSFEELIFFFVKLSSLMIQSPIRSYFQNLLLFRRQNPSRSTSTSPTSVTATCRSALWAFTAVSGWQFDFLNKFRVFSFSLSLGKSSLFNYGPFQACFFQLVVVL